MRPAIVIKFSNLQKKSSEILRAVVRAVQKSWQAHGVALKHVTLLEPNELEIIICFTSLA